MRLKMSLTAPGLFKSDVTVWGINNNDKAAGLERNPRPYNDIRGCYRYDGPNLQRLVVDKGKI
jgi:hypothetical protein